MLSPLYPILDSAYLSLDLSARAERLRELMLELLAAGVTLLQYRNKLGSEAEVLADALVLRAAAPVGSCVLILNDFAELAVRAGFDGVHVGQTDMAAERARAIVGVDRMLGVSTHNPEQLMAAGLSSADYVAIGPVFATSTKADADPVVGVEGVRRARALTTKPLVAIGGIMVENCQTVIDAGADSVAVISSLFADASGRSAGVMVENFLGVLR